MNNTIWYVGGNSAGHIIPLLTLGNQHTGRAVFFTANSDLDRYIMRGYTQGEHVMITGALPKKWYRVPLFLAQVLRDCLHIARLLYHRPDHVITTGGFVAIPVVLIARLVGVPCDLFELNVVPGKAVLFLSRYARTVYYCFDDVRVYFPKNKTVWRPYPVRSRAALPELSRDAHRTLAVVGGSQGSHFLNTLVLQVMALLSPEDRAQIHVIHQAGQESEAVLAAYRTLGIDALVQPYFDDIDHVYGVADRVICRAGAGTLWELVHHKKQSLVIPLKTQTNNHQVANARAMGKSYPELIWLLEQEDAHAQYDAVRAWLMGPRAQELVDHQAALDYP